MNWVDLELVLVSLAAMLSPLTLMWSVLALVLSKRPLFTGFWFYLGALVATLAVGVAAAFVFGNAAASRHKSTPKTWVAVVDIIGAILLLVWVVRMLRRPADPEKDREHDGKDEQGCVVPAVAIFGAGALLANPAYSSRSLSKTSPRRTRAVASTSSNGSPSRWCRCSR